MLAVFLLSYRGLYMFYSIGHRVMSFRTPWLFYLTVLQPKIIKIVVSRIKNEILIAGKKSNFT